MKLLAWSVQEVHADELRWRMQIYDQHAYGTMGKACAALKETPGVLEVIVADVVTRAQRGWVEDKK